MDEMKIRVPVSHIERNALRQLLITSVAPALEEIQIAAEHGAELEETSRIADAKSCVDIGMELLDHVGWALEVPDWRGWIELADLGYLVALLEGHRDELRKSEQVTEGEGERARQEIEACESMIQSCIEAEADQQPVIA